MKQKHISSFVGTFEISKYEEVLNILREVARKYNVSIWGRGRGSREVGKRVYVSPWDGEEHITNDYHQHLPLKHSERVSFYIRVRPTKKFVSKNKLWGHKSDYDTVENFQEFSVPFIRKEMVMKLYEKLSDFPF